MLLCEVPLNKYAIGRVAFTDFVTLEDGDSVAVDEAVDEID